MIAKLSRILAFLMLVGATLPSSFAGQVSSFDSIPAGFTQTGDWLSFGNVQFSPSSSPTVVGDAVSGVDRLISANAAQGNARLSFTGCVPLTAQSNEWIGLSQPNAGFASNPAVDPIFGVDIAFSTVWNQPNQLWILRNDYAGFAANFPIAANLAPALTGSGFCADYRIERIAGIVSAYINNALVYTGASFYPNAPEMAYVQSWDTAFTLSSVSLDLGAPGSVPEPGSLALFGLGLAGLCFRRFRKALTLKH